MGYTADFNMWDKALSYDDMVAFTTCKTYPKSSFLPWNIDDWTPIDEQTKFLKEVEVDPKEFCEKSDRYLYFYKASNFDRMDEFCHKFGGQTVNVSTKDQLMDTMDFFIDMHSNSDWGLDAWDIGNYITPYTDKDKEGTYIHKDYPDEMPYINWHLLEPDGEKGENCLVNMMTVDNDTITNVIGRDYSCGADFVFNVLCENPRKFLGKIYGLCKKTSFDTSYKLSKLPSNFDEKKMYFSGNFGWQIIWEEANKFWKLSKKRDNSTYATQADSDYPLGRKQWDVYNDKCNIDGGLERIFLTFSSCRDDEFTCDNGICIPMEHRCDQKQDCKDVTDEKNCITVSIDPNKYLKDKPPPALPGKDKAEVRVSLNLLDILSLAVVDMKITTKYELQLEWIDPRITFLNLKENTNLNGLIPFELQQIWIPSIIFSNTQADDFSILDRKTIGAIKRNGPFTKSGQDDKENIYRFSGSANPIILNRVYETEWICNYDMR